MTKLAKHISSIFLFGIFILLAMGSVNQKALFAISEYMIPPDFKEFDGTLLIPSKGKLVDVVYKNKFEKNYTGKYKIIHKEELDGDYADSTVYRYYFGFDMRETMPNDYQSQFYVYDRLKQKRYVTQWSDFDRKMMSSYIRALEAARKK